MSAQRTFPLQQHGDKDRPYLSGLNRRGRPNSLGTQSRARHKEFLPVLPCHCTVSLLSSPAPPDLTRNASSFVLLPQPLPTLDQVLCPWWGLSRREMVAGSRVGQGTGRRHSPPPVFDQRTLKLNSAAHVVSCSGRRGSREAQGFGSALKSHHGLVSSRPRLQCLGLSLILTPPRLALRRWNKRHSFVALLTRQPPAVAASAPPVLGRRV